MNPFTTYMSHSDMLSKLNDMWTTLSLQNTGYKQYVDINSEYMNLNASKMLNISSDRMHLQTNECDILHNGQRLNVLQVFHRLTELEHIVFQIGLECERLKTDLKSAKWLYMQDLEIKLIKLPNGDIMRHVADACWNILSFHIMFLCCEYALE